MARNKEGLILLLDIGPSMHVVLPEVEKVCSLLVQKKLIFGKSDEVGIVLFGAEGTENELEKEVGGYEHVVVLRNIKVVDGNAVEALKNLPRGTFYGDFLDAIVVGMDMLIKKYGPTNKGKQRLCLITDAQYPIKEPYEGTKEDQVAAISQQMKAHGMKLDCIVFRRKSMSAAEQIIAHENDHLLDQFSRNTIAKTLHVYDPMSLSGALRTRNIAPFTVYRGDLELSPTMKIKVWVYKKTAEEKFPSMKKYSDKAPPSDKFATHEVKVDFEYKSMDDTDKVVPPEQRVKGYRYGPQVVPISSAEWEAFKFKPEKGVKLLGFTNASNIMRHYYMKDVNAFIPEPGNSKAIVAVSAIARAMKEMNKVAILRCVWRQGQANVVIGVLTPNISSVDNIPDSFYFNILPFAEDIREFHFPSLSNFPLSLKPNEEQQEAADNLVSMLDLAPSEREEVLQPDFTPNPVLERFYRFLDLKSKEPDADVLPLDKSLERITKSDPELISQNKSVIESFHKHFELKENPKKKKSSRTARRENLSISNEVGVKADGETSSTSHLVKDASAVKVEKISDLNPVQDFEAMMARRDSSKWVTQGIKEMQNYIFTLLENSYEGDAYPKAIDCLLALRRGCICEQEPKEFNKHLRELYEKLRQTDLANFFELVQSKNIKLISRGEAADRLPATSLAGCSPPALVDIAMTLDVAYLRGSMAAIHSVLQHTACPQSIRFHLVASANLAHLNATIAASLPSLSFRIYLFDDTRVAGLISTSVRAALDRPLNYARSYLAQILPTCINKIVYLDSDLVVVDDIQSLAATPLTNSAVLAAPEYCKANFTFYFTPTFWANSRLSEMFERRRACYFNTGVMVMDLERWRAGGHTERIEEWMRLQRRMRIYELGSLPPFLLEFAGRIAAVDHRWNQHGLGGDNLRGLCRDLHPGQVSLLHWSGKGKPWARLDAGRPCPLDALWAPYDLLRTPFGLEDS